jgi:hypothetical protein
VSFHRVSQIAGQRFLSILEEKRDGWVTMSIIEDAAIGVISRLSPPWREL